jgi:hypothetical protein
MVIGDFKCTIAKLGFSYIRKKRAGIESILKAICEKTTMTRDLRVYFQRFRLTRLTNVPQLLPIHHLVLPALWQWRGLCV